MGAHAYPYEDPELDIMEQTSQITSLFTVFCGLFISANLVVGPLTVLVVVANLLFVAYFLYLVRGELVLQGGVLDQVKKTVEKSDVSRRVLSRRGSGQRSAKPTLSQSEPSSGGSVAKVVPV